MAFQVIGVWWAVFFCLCMPIMLILKASMSFSYVAGIVTCVLVSLAMSMIFNRITLFIYTGNSKGFAKLINRVETEGPTMEIADSIIELVQSSKSAAHRNNMLLAAADMYCSLRDAKKAGFALDKIEANAVNNKSQGGSDKLFYLTYYIVQLKLNILLEDRKRSEEVLEILQPYIQEFSELEGYNVMIKLVQVSYNTFINNYQGSIDILLTIEPENIANHNVVYNAFLAENYIGLGDYKKSVMYLNKAKASYMPAYRNSIEDIEKSFKEKFSKNKYQ